MNSLKHTIKTRINTSDLSVSLQWLTFIIILIGVVIRLIVLLRNNCFILDEVNVALNVYERNFLQLFEPLNNEQFAPPGFLVITKVFTEIFGYSEHFFRLYAFLSGVLALWVFVLVLKRYVSFNVIWYPLFIVAIGFIYVRYSISVKQYSGDMLFTLLLVLLALEKDIVSMSSKTSVLLWSLAGSIAIWFSMPAMFVLTGVGVYFLVLILKRKSYVKIYPLIIIGSCWLLNFVIYFQILLRYQVSSDYLQQWHNTYFLNFLPFDKATWEHNWELIKILLSTMGGNHTLSLVFHISMMLWGVLYYIRKYSEKVLLIIIPLILCIIAVFLHKYTLLERVMLFAFPLILILVAGGMQALFDIRNIIPRLVVIACGVISIVNFSELGNMDKKRQHEEITVNMKYVIDMGVTGDGLYLNRFAVPSFRYYTTIHPGKDQWVSIKNAKELLPDTDFKQLAANLNPRGALLYSFEDWAIIEREIGAMREHATEIGYHTVPVGWVSVFAKK